MKKNIIKTVSNSDISIKNSTKYDDENSSLDNDSSLHDLMKTISQNTLSSTHRIFEYCDKSELYGINTCKNLVNQDEKLNNIEYGLGKINNDLAEVEENFVRLNKKGYFFFFFEILFECCCCLCCWCCTKSPDEKESAESLTAIKKSPKRSMFGFISKIKSKRNKKINKSDSTFISSASSFKMDSSFKSTSEDGSFLSNRFESKLKIKNIYANERPIKSEDSHTGLSLRQTSFDKSIMNLSDQLNNSLKFLDTRLTSLQSMANDIGNELTKQSSKIELTTNLTEANKIKTERANEVGKKFLSKDN